jgi:hypothetical protein
MVNMLTSLPAATLLLGLALGQWLLVVALNLFKRTPKLLVASTVVVAAGLINTLAVRRENAAVKASALSPQPAANCALVEAGMSADTVRAKLGKPPEVRDDGKTRGPGAVTWVYRDSRCAVHLLDEKVELVE